MKAIKGFVKKEKVPVERAKLAPLERTIDNCTVISIPAGAAPKNVIVELPGSDGARVAARWSGFPAIAVSDSVSVRKSAGSGAQYTITGTSSSTPAVFAGTPVAGALITGSSTPEWVVLPPGDVGQYVTKNEAGTLEWRDIPTVGITEFLYDAASDITDYFQLKTDVPTGVEQTIVSAAVSADDTLIFNLATNSGGPGVDFINDGVWHLHLHAQKSGPGTKEVTLKFRVYTRTDPGGVETQIGSGYSESTGNLTTSAVEYDLHLALDELALDITDRIVAKIYADVSGAGTDPTVTLTVEGDTDSRLEIPAVVASGGAGGGWPAAGKAMINNTEYDTVQDAIDAMAAADIIKIGQGTDTGGITVDAAGALVGLSPTETIITHSTDGAITTTVSAADVTFANLTIASTGAGVFPRCLYSNQARTRIRNCTIQKTSGAPNLAVGVLVDSGGTCTIEAGTQITVSTGTTRQALYVDGTGSVVVEAGVVLNGTDADIYLDNNTATVELRGCTLLGGGINNAAGGTVKGWYINSSGMAVMIAENTLPQTLVNANNLYEVASASDSDFTATINGTPSGTSVVYNTPSSGAANAIKPTASTQLAKLVLHNTTRGNDALISDVNTGTSTITLTATVPADWASGDTITARSQTNTDNPSGGARFFDYEITSGIDATLTKAIVVYISVSDTGGAGCTLILHPYEAGAASKRWSVITQGSLFFPSAHPRLKITSNRFCVAWDATGSGTATVTLRLFGQNLGL